MAIEEYLAKKLEEHVKHREPAVEYLNKLWEKYEGAPSRISEDRSFDWDEATIMIPKIKSLLIEYYDSFSPDDRGFKDPRTVDDELTILHFATAKAEKIQQYIRDETERMRVKELNYLFNEVKVSSMTGFQLQTILVDAIEKVSFKRADND